MGYVAYPEGRADLTEAMLKAQDTTVICPPRVSQVVAKAALEAGPAWVREQIEATVVKNRTTVTAALAAALGEASIVGGTGAIYLMAELPPARGGPADDRAVVEWLAEEHKVVLIPGSACGSPGWVRVAFANLEPGVCAEAARRMEAGLTALVEGQGPGGAQ
mmetsp:Transcript_18016/g.43944  ORF Transcript_18016/g.43944 Transcript_18016/m.43944 type:complete len:162 (+) Transcript_18016:1-486(+)